MTRHLKYSTSLTTLKLYPLLLSLNGGVAFYVHPDLSYERSETTLAFDYAAVRIQNNIKSVRYDVEQPKSV